MNRVINKYIQEAEDRIAIRELIDRNTSLADSRNTAAQMSMFDADVHFFVFMDSKSEGVAQELRIRGDFAAGFDYLNIYKSTVQLNGDAATGVSYCMAHHLSNGDKPELIIAAIRYLDKFIRLADRWYFQDRKLVVDWIENRRI